MEEERYQNLHQFYHEIIYRTDNPTLHIQVTMTWTKSNLDLIYRLNILSKS